MRSRPILLFLAVDLGVSLLLALGYGLRWGTCAPPSFLCELPGIACPAVCRDAWAQFPEVTSAGLIVSFPPGSASFLAGYGRYVGDRKGVPGLWRRLAPKCATASAVLLASANLSFFLISRTPLTFAAMLAAFIAGVLLLTPSLLAARERRGRLPE